MKALLDKYFAFIRRFIPEQDQETKVGIDIGQDCCYLAQLVDKGDGHELIHWAMEPIEGGNVQHALETVLGRMENLPKEIVTAVSGKGTLIRYIDMPRMSPTDMKNSLILEADKYFPFDPDSVYIDAHILDPKSKNKMMSVLVAAVKKEMVDERIQILTDLGYQPNFMGISSIANANAFEKFGPCTEEEFNNLSCALIDVGDSLTNLMIIENGVPRFTRDIYIGQKEIVRRVANGLGMEFKEALDLCERPGVRKEQLSEACEAIFANLISEIRLSLDYFSTEKNIQIKKIFLMGSGALISGIDEVFINTLDVELELWGAVHHLSVSDSLSSEEITAQSLKLNTAIGLAVSND